MFLYVNVNKAKNRNVILMASNFLTKSATFFFDPEIPHPTKFWSNFVFFWNPIFQNIYNFKLKNLVECKFVTICLPDFIFFIQIQ